MRDILNFCNSFLTAGYPYIALVLAILALLLCSKQPIRLSLLNLTIGKS